MISLEQKHFTLHSVQDDAVDPPSWHSSLNLHGNPFRFFLLSGISFVSWGTLKLFENFQLLSKWAQWFRSLMKMYSSLLLQLVFFAFCMLLNINFTMEIIKNASLANSSNINKKKPKLLSIGCSIHIYYEWSMFVFMAVWWLMCIYIYACFVAVQKNIIYILLSWNWSATLLHAACIPKGLNGWAAFVILAHSPRVESAFEVSIIVTRFIVEIKISLLSMLQHWSSESQPKRYFYVTIFHCSFGWF